MLEFLLKKIDTKTALAQIASVDFGPIVREQFDKLAAHFAQVQGVGIDTISIIYQGGQLHLTVAGAYKGIMSDADVLAILKPTGMLALIKTQLVQVVRSQLDFLCEHFAAKHAIPIDSAQIVTVHGAYPGTWVGHSGVGYLEFLNDKQVNDLLAGNFSDLKELA